MFVYFTPSKFIFKSGIRLLLTLVWPRDFSPVLPSWVLCHLSKPENNFCGLTWVFNDLEHTSPGYKHLRYVSHNCSMCCCQSWAAWGFPGARYPSKPPMSSLFLNYEAVLWFLPVTSTSTLSHLAPSRQGSNLPTRKTCTSESAYSRTAYGSRLLWQTSVSKNI